MFLFYKHNRIIGLKLVPRRSGGQVLKIKLYTPPPPPQGGGGGGGY